MQRATRSQGELWWLSTPKGSTRHEIAAYQKRITREQAACGLPQYSVWIFETRPELHAHMVFVGNLDVADILRRSRLCIATKIEPITDIGGLKNYLAKERIPQAGYRRRDLGGRIRGSHRLTGGGDRVRLSRQLERDAIEAGMEAHERQTISSAQRLPTTPFEPQRGGAGRPNGDFAHKRVGQMNSKILRKIEHLRDNNEPPA